MAFGPLAYFGVALARRPEPVDVTIVRAVEPSRVGVGEDATVTLTITNNGSRLERLLVHDIVPRGLFAANGGSAAHLLLEPGATHVTQYVVTGVRGAYTCDKVSVQSDETFGLFGNFTVVGTSPVTLLVRPNAELVGANRIHPERTRGFAGPLPARVAGAGVNFLSLREYQPGDRLRAINWRATERLSARSPGESSALYTNVFEQQRIADIGLIVDARSKVDSLAGGETVFEYSVRAAMSLSESFLDDGHRVSLMIYGSGVNSVSPGYGRLQQQRINLALSAARTGDHYVFDRLSSIPTKIFSAGTQLIFVGPATAGDVDGLSGLRGRGYALLVVSPSPLAATLLSVVPVENQSVSDLINAELAVNFAQLERMSHLHQLRREGVVVVDWDLRSPLHEVVRQAELASRGQRTVRSF